MMSHWRANSRRAFEKMDKVDVLILRPIDFALLVGAGILWAREYYVWFVVFVLVAGVIDEIRIVRRDL